MSVEKAEEVLDDFAEEMEEHAAISNELKLIIGNGVGEADDSELLDELKALEEDIAGLNMGNGDKTAMHGSANSSISSSSCDITQEVVVSLPIAPQNSIAASASRVDDKAVWKLRCPNLYVGAPQPNDDEMMVN